MDDAANLYCRGRQVLGKINRDIQPFVTQAIYNILQDYAQCSADPDEQSVLTRHRICRRNELSATNIPQRQAYVFEVEQLDQAEKSSSAATRRPIISAVPPINMSPHPSRPARTKAAPQHDSNSSSGLLPLAIAAQLRGLRLPGSSKIRPRRNCRRNWMNAMPRRNTDNPRATCR